VSERFGLLAAGVIPVITPGVLAVTNALATHWTDDPQALQDVLREESTIKPNSQKRIFYFSD